MLGPPPVQAHGHELGDLAGHARHAVHALVLQPPALQGVQAARHEPEAGLVQEGCVCIAQLLIW